MTKVWEAQFKLMKNNFLLNKQDENLSTMKESFSKSSKVCHIIHASSGTADNETILPSSLNIYTVMLVRELT